MIDDLIKQQAQLQRQVDGIVVPELSPDLISPFLSIPALVGFWPMSSVQRSTGNAYDIGGQSRILTYNGNPTYNFLPNGTPYIDLDGTGDYLSRADETDLDVLGTETIYAAAVRGLTLGGWFWANVIGSEYGLITKRSPAAGNLSYWLRFLNANTLAFNVSVDGTATAAVQSTTTILANAWYFCVGRFVPSTSLDVFLLGAKTTNTVGIPASIFNGNAALEIGSYGGGGKTLPGRASLCFLSANALSDGKISSVFQQTRGAFGV